MTEVRITKPVAIIMMYLKNILKSSTCIVPLNPAVALSWAKLTQKDKGTIRPTKHKGAKSFLLDEKRSTMIMRPASQTMLISGVINSKSM